MKPYWLLLWWCSLRGKNTLTVKGVYCTNGSTPCMRTAVWWTVVTLIVYATFYGVLFLYEIVEGVCLGWPGVVILTVTMDYTFASNGGVVELGELGEGVEILSGRMSRVRTVATILGTVPVPPLE
ncbi:uncharacterized protein PITG_14303 [Phytophthora infestans T30-4]|uniref:Transmembrane protein n=1 Tax=Phytophthora infestans (strain T30-4) TaxID=403677 RepID=D0NPJ7_PHYIT|nr:uncharacterized protein PITG_14303 [Phytophthora infestans T30-4]EEY62559.1 conserved hypothetical protein [Phytophthora infestans T30-4]|eukprot:XP_002898801.1 conserved hypothetical protein [Phytophthora infestans T30-4]